MRYYKIIITNPTTGQVVVPPGFDRLLGGATYTSFVNNQTLPNAWNVILDIPVTPFAAPAGAAYIQVWGISLAEISQAHDLNGKNIQVFGGMQKGLPLANPKQAGLLAEGTIIQAFGNWLGTDQTLDLILTPPFGTIEKPANITMQWPPNTKFADGIRATLSTAFPGYTINVNISSSLVRAGATPGFYQTLGQFAQYLESASRQINRSPDYLGIQITSQGKTINVVDGTVKPKPKQLAFQDLIGQPTWIGLNTINFKTVMRADIAVNDLITFPPGILATTTAQSSSQFRDKSAFQGTFLVSSVRHVGNFRQADGASWVSVFDVVQTSTTGA